MRTCQRERGIWEGGDKRNKDMGEDAVAREDGTVREVDVDPIRATRTHPFPSHPHVGTRHTRAVAKRTRESRETRAQGKAEKRTSHIPRTLSTPAAAAAASASATRNTSRSSRRM
jgi:hypothetical protein